MRKPCPGLRSLSDPSWAVLPLLLLKSINRLLAERKRRAERTKPPRAQLEDVLGELRGLFPGELSGRLAAALLAKKSLDTTRQVDEPFPEAYFSGTAAIDAAAQADLRRYEQKLQTFREHCVAHKSTFTISVARGLGVWIVSAHALAEPELLPLGRDLWERLSKGADNLEEAYRLLLRREITDVEKTYMSYRPAALMLTGPVVVSAAAPPSDAAIWKRPAS